MISQKGILAFVILVLIAAPAWSTGMKADRKHDMKPFEMVFAYGEKVSKFVVDSLGDSYVLTYTSSYGDRLKAHLTPDAYNFLVKKLDQIQDGRRLASDCPRLYIKAEYLKNGRGRAVSSCLSADSHSRNQLMHLANLMATSLEVK